MSLLLQSYVPLFNPKLVFRKLAPKLWRPVMAHTQTLQTKGIDLERDGHNTENHSLMGPFIVPKCQRINSNLNTKIIYFNPIQISFLICTWRLP